MWFRISPYRTTSSTKPVLVEYRGRGFLVMPYEVVHLADYRIKWLAGVCFFRKVYEDDIKMSRGFIRNLPAPPDTPGL
jgi:hypothetical protein